MTGKVVRPESVPLYRNADGTQRFRPTHDRTDTAAQGSSGGLYWVAGHSRNDPDIHPTCDELYYIVHGQGTIWFGDEAQPLRAGDTVVVPAGTTHHIVNDGDEDIELFFVFVPPPPSSTGTGVPRGFTLVD